MEIAIGLPNAVPGTTGEQLTDWARRADKAGFSSLGTIDRITYPNLEPLIALAAAGAVTERIRLATTIMIVPVRENATYLAEQAASLQKLSDGRLVLGLAVGGREDDYEAAGVDFSTRGKAFEAMMSRIREVWDGSAKSSGSADDSGVGPDVASNPPKVIMGGSADIVFERAAKYGDGWIMGGGAPDAFKEGREKLEKAWSDAGRDGKPQTAALSYFALGDQGEANANAYLGDYYEWLGEYAQGIADSAAKDAETVKGYIQAFEEAGCDELFFIPASSDPDQVDLLAEAAL
jgi:alkanesulfonate monooxygenase SsuD/methylene tetrahydromethanopterin reductase-like flavin-dependent oxidoreductase (luciferase family)